MSVLELARESEDPATIEYIENIVEKATMDLRSAAIEGDVDAVKHLIEDQGARLDEVDAVGQSVLHIAACHNSVRVIEELLEHGADPEMVSNVSHEPSAGGPPHCLTETYPLVVMFQDGYTPYDLAEEEEMGETAQSIKRWASSHNKLKWSTRIMNAITEEGGDNTSDQASNDSNRSLLSSPKVVHVKVDSVGAIPEEFLLDATGSAFGSPKAEEVEERIEPAATPGHPTTKAPRIRELTSEAVPAPKPAAGNAASGTGPITKAKAAHRGSKPTPAPAPATARSTGAAPGRAKSSAASSSRRGVTAQPGSAAAAAKSKPPVLALNKPVPNPRKAATATASAAGSTRANATASGRSSSGASKANATRGVGKPGSQRAAAAQPPVMFKVTKPTSGAPPSGSAGTKAKPASGGAASRKSTSTRGPTRTSSNGSNKRRGSSSSNKSGAGGASGGGGAGSGGSRGGCGAGEGAGGGTVPKRTTSMSKRSYAKPWQVSQRSGKGANPSSSSSFRRLHSGLAKQPSTQAAGSSASQRKGVAGTALPKVADAASKGKPAARSSHRVTRTTATTRGAANSRASSSAAPKSGNGATNSAASNGGASKSGATVTPRPPANGSAARRNSGRVGAGNTHRKVSAPAGSTKGKARAVPPEAASASTKANAQQRIPRVGSKSAAAAPAKANDARPAVAATQPLAPSKPKVQPVAGGSAASKQSPLAKRQLTAVAAAQS